MFIYIYITPPEICEVAALFRKQAGDFHNSSLKPNQFAGG